MLNWHQAAANDTDPEPGDVIYGRVDYDGGIFPRGTLVTFIVLQPGDVPDPGALCIFDDGEDIVVGRFVQVGDWWTVDDDVAGLRRRLLRDRWTLRASVRVEPPGCWATPS